ncbi:MAG: exodeoxyribonuclease VII large subunit [Clostridium sp.]
MKIKTLSVSEVNNYIKRSLDNDFILRNLSVKGEISNIKYHSSGHIYFSLKDSFGKINCVMFKTYALNLKEIVEDGMEVVISASCSIYPKDGSLQLYCKEIKREGIGELHIKFEELKNKLSKEGYFDDEYKKEIPSFIRRVGVVTSETGAVIRDIINVTQNRSKLVDIVLYPANVQGEGAYKSIIQGIKYFNKSKSVDVIIIGRGGGSLEELWNFNEEELAIEIFKSKLPIVSAVGHEVDYTISDFVSDRRASTPSHAAEIIVKVESELYDRIKHNYKNLNQSFDYLLRREFENISNLQERLRLNSPKVKIVNSYIEVDNLKERLNKEIFNKLNHRKNELSHLKLMLEAHNPVNVLNRGYSIIQDTDNNVISSIEDIKSEKEIKMILKDGIKQGVFKPIDKE